MSVSEDDFLGELQKLMQDSENYKNPIVAKIEEFVKSRYVKFVKVENTNVARVFDIHASCCALDIYLKIMILASREVDESTIDITTCIFRTDIWEFSVHRLAQVIVVRSRRQSTGNLDGFIEFSPKELASDEAA